ncbi:unnamed protein product [Brassicogethes aeneus]|uniref:Uncharacterized protein n=1 Tax=Brassicogethes aeneus TaxID=1431903 RepID=A0A9P0B507_BRAAE|nr:unnamed protein product [Brassicogethes aeneus]
MRLKTILLCVSILVLLYALSLIEVAESKRSGGSRSKGRSSSSGSSFWNRKKTNSAPGNSPGVKPEVKPGPSSVLSPAPKPAVQPKPAAQPQQNAQQPKPSAPVQEQGIKKEQAGVQQNSPDQQRPIGWNANSQNPPHGQHNAQAPPPYNQAGHQPQGPPAYGQNPPAYGQQSPNGYGQAPPAYNPHGYPQQGHSPNGYGQAPPAYNAHGYPQQGHYPQGGPPGYSPYGNGQPSFGGPPGYNQGYMGNAYGGYNQQKSGGMFGGMFGGNRGGYGGYGGMGGYGGYGMKKSGGFFGRHAFRNILGGMVLWYVVSGLFRRPYKVYNYYNQPETTEHIQLPANILTLCDTNSTNICVPGSTAICTTNSTILCVTTMQAAVPCPEQNQALCVNSTIPCVDKDDPLCQNATAGSTTANINLPCFANVTVDVNLIDYSNSNGTAKGGGQDYSYCVTTMAIPGPEELDCSEDETNSTSTTTLKPGCVKPNIDVVPTPLPPFNATISPFGNENGTKIFMNENGTYAYDKGIIPIENGTIIENGAAILNDTIPAVPESAPAA